MWDDYIDAWAIAVGALEGFGPPEAVPRELRQAASVLLALPEAGAMTGWPGWGASRLSALGGDPWQGLRALPQLRTVEERGDVPFDEELARVRNERDTLFRTVFGARKRVIEALQLPPDIVEALPKPLTVPPDAEPPPPAATARRLIAWARGGQVETEVVDGPADLVGEDLTTWHPIQLATADPVVAEEAMTFVLRFRNGHQLQLLVPPGRSDWEGVAACQTPRSGCEVACPLRGRPVCDKYHSAVGWAFKDKHRKASAHDPRRIDEIPARTQPPRTSEWVDAVTSSRRTPALAETA